jgi:hypothetical protein
MDNTGKFESINPDVNDHDEVPVKERKFYKGDRVGIRSVLSPDMSPVFVQVIERSGTDPYKREVKYPGLLLLEGFSLYGRDYSYVTARQPRSGFKRGNWVFKDTHEVIVLSGRMKDTLTAEYHEWFIKSNLQGLGSWRGAIGADPEVFVTKGDDVVPAWEFLGSKQSMSSVQAVGGRSCAYWDGFQAEFSVPAVTCLAYLTDNVQAGLQAVHKNRPKGAKLSNRPVLPVSPETLETAEDRHVEFGCAPSLNVYGLEGSKVPGRQVGIRFAGGHMHFGCKDILKADPKAADRIVRALDGVIGVTCVSWFKNYDDPVRREFYGLPGEYRLPPHGLEYRTLSNAWLIHPAVMNVTWEIARRALIMGKDGWYERIWQHQDKVVDCIRRSDAHLAQEILLANKATWIQLLEGCAGVFAGTGESAFSWVMDGVETRLKSDDIETNWLLKSGGWVHHGEAPNANWRRASEMLRAGYKL